MKTAASPVFITSVALILADAQKLGSPLRRCFISGQLFSLMFRPSLGARQGCRIINHRYQHLSLSRPTALSLGKLIANRHNAQYWE